MKTLGRIFSLFSLVVVIFAGRRLWFYGGGYQPPEVTDIQPDAMVLAPTMDHQPFVDVPIAGNGYVLVDMAHRNNLTRNELTSLQSRLEARGATVEFFDGATVLTQMLYRATAMIVLAPSVEFTSEEQKAIAAFVDDGGRVFMAADPTRPALSDSATEDAEITDIYDSFFPISAVPAINSVANVFDVVYFDDYLYNLAENAGNYRNVAFSPASDQTPLTQDVENVVFFAAHSLQGTGTTLLSGDTSTVSSVRTGERELSAAMLVADGQVLALGDITFLTAPYHTIADNDRFLSCIADWLAEDTRARDALEDFPYLFHQSVDLVQLSGDLVDPQLIAQGGALQTYVEEAGLSLTLRTDVVPDHDALLLGLFGDGTTLEELLAHTGITVITAAGGDGFSSALPASEETPGSALEMEPLLEIPSLGTLSAKGITLFSVDCTSERCRVSVVAETAAEVAAAVERLVYHNFDGCAHVGTITLCASEAVSDLSSGDIEAFPQGRILIISVEDGITGVRTGAAEFMDILDDTYAVTVWTIPDDGEPAASDLEGYDVYIVDSGDYAGGFIDSPAFRAISMIESSNILLIGAQPLPVDTADAGYAPIDDLIVGDTAHPLLEGFVAGEVISLLPSESAIPAMIISDDSNATESVALMLRGPNSPQSGSPALIVALDEMSGVNRIIVATFAFYRLPESVQFTLAHNIAAWLMEGGQ